MAVPAMTKATQMTATQMKAVDLKRKMTEIVKPVEAQKQITVKTLRTCSPALRPSLLLLTNYQGPTHSESQTQVWIHSQTQTWIPSQTQTYS